MTAEYRILELFSGIGGMHFAFQYAKLPGNVVAAMDINTVANTVYAHNHPKTDVLNNNIQKLSVKQIAKLGVNMVLMSPPCQPFTRVGNQRDVDDSRTDALKHLCELLPQCHCIEYVLMENVKGFETSRAHDCYIKALKTSGFYLREFILSPTQFGVPNTRHRYYCIARRNRDFTFGSDANIAESFPKQQGERENARFTIETILQDESEIPENLYLDDAVLRKRIWLMDIVCPEYSNSMCFTKAYTHYSEGTGSVLTRETSDRVKEIFEEIKEMSKEDPRYVQLLKALRLRYFTPTEVARLMSFPSAFSFPQETSTRQKYRLLGNSINVLVVGDLIKLLSSVD